MPVLQNCQCIISWKSVKLGLPVIGSMADLYRLHNSLLPTDTFLKVVTSSTPLKMPALESVLNIAFHLSVNGQKSVRARVTLFHQL